MKEEIEGTGGTNFTERKNQNTETHMLIAFKYINDLYKEEDIKIFSISTVGSKRSNRLTNETDEYLSEMTQI